MSAVDDFKFTPVQNGRALEVRHKGELLDSLNQRDALEFAKRADLAVSEMLRST